MLLQMMTLEEIARQSGWILEQSGSGPTVEYFFGKDDLRIVLRWRGSGSVSITWHNREVPWGVPLRQWCPQCYPPTKEAYVEGLLPLVTEKECKRRIEIGLRGRVTGAEKTLHAAQEALAAFLKGT